MEQKWGSNILVWSEGREGQAGRTMAFWDPKVTSQPGLASQRTLVEGGSPSIN